MLKLSPINFAISVARSHRSIGVRVVVFLAPLKRCKVVREEVEWGQFGGTYGSIL